MGNHIRQENKKKVFELLQQLNYIEYEDMKSLLQNYYHEDFVFHCSHPFNQIDGLDNYLTDFWQDFSNSFPHFERRDTIFFAGEFKDGDWVCATGNYHAIFKKSWLGIPANNQPINIRYGEFYRLEDGKIVEQRTLFDIIDVMIQAGINLFPPSLGVEQLFPAPRTLDGILISEQPDDESKQTLKLVEDMIYVGLAPNTYDNFKSLGMKRYWHDHFCWYGPAGIGTTRGIKGFQDWHQYPFIKAFPDRKGGDHKARFAEGNYCASTGWPSIQATHTGDGWYGLAPTNKKITMRVMDFWRREGDLLIENWVFIDILDILQQLGYDIFDRMAQHLESKNLG